MPHTPDLLPSLAAANVTEMVRAYKSPAIKLYFNIECLGFIGDLQGNFRAIK